MKLTSVFLGDAERQALEQLARASGKSRSECLRVAIREAVNRTRDVSDKLMMAMGVGMSRVLAFRAETGDPVSCEDEGYQIRGSDGVLRCDSGEYDRDNRGALRCVHCRRKAA